MNPPNTAPTDRHDTWTYTLRIIAHLLLLLHFALSPTPNTVALVTLLVAYGITIATLAFPHCQTGGLCATMLLLPMLNILVATEHNHGIEDLPYMLWYGFIGLAPALFHFYFYAITLSDTDEDGNPPADNAMLLMDGMFAFFAAVFVVYVHHPTSVATFAQDVFEQSWFIGVAALAIGIIVYASRQKK